MDKEFIPYEQALELKELGFNKWCLALYPHTYNEEIQSSLEFVSGITGKIKFEQSQFQTLAPLYQQAFRWFREKGYRVGIRWDVEYDKYWFDVWSSYKKNDETFYQFQFESEIIYNTYEEAELACLKKLIEIAKNI